MSLVSKEELEKEMQNYDSVVNSIVGVIFLTLSLGSIGTDNPQATAIILLPIAFWLFYFMNKHFPPTIKTLKKMKNQKEYSKDKKEIDEIIKNFENQNFNYKRLFSLNLVYIYSTMFYFMLVIWYDFGIAIKTGEWLTHIIFIFN